MERLAPPIETLRTRRLLLRPVCADDAHTIARNAADLDVVRNTLSMPHPYTLDDAHAFLARVAAQHESGTGYVWTLRVPSPDLPQGDHVGTLGVHCVWDHRHAEIGYVLRRDAWGRGYATEALTAAVHFAFTRTPLERVHASYFSRNPASGRVLEKCGFTREGYRPHMFFRFGQWTDQVLMGLLRTDWQARRQPLDAGR